MTVKVYLVAFAFGWFFNKIWQKFLGVPNALANMRHKHDSQPGLKSTFQSFIFSPKKEFAIMESKEWCFQGGNGHCVSVYNQEAKKKLTFKLK